MQQDVPQLEVVPLEGGNHNITYARADEVAAELVAALK